MTEILERPSEARPLDIAGLAEDIQQQLTRLARRALRGVGIADAIFSGPQAVAALYEPDLDHFDSIKARRLGIEAIAAEALQ